MTNRVRPFFRFSQPTARLTRYKKCGSVEAVESTSQRSTYIFIAKEAQKCFYIFHTSTSKSGDRFLLNFQYPFGEPVQCDVKVDCVSVSVFDQKAMKPAVPPAVS